MSRARRPQGSTLWPPRPKTFHDFVHDLREFDFRHHARKRLRASTADPMRSGRSADRTRASSASRSSSGAREGDIARSNARTTRFVRSPAVNSVASRSSTEAAALQRVGEGSPPPLSAIGADERQERYHVALHSSGRVGLFRGILTARSARPPQRARPDSNGGPAGSKPDGSSRSGHRTPSQPRHHAGLNANRGGQMG